MRKQRGSDGRFLPAEEVEVEAVRRGVPVFQEFGVIIYWIWKALPVIMVLLLVWSLGGMTDKIKTAVLEIFWGKNCMVTCKNHMSSQNGQTTSDPKTEF
jgi:hypothetical protein